MISMQNDVEIANVCTQVKLYMKCSNDTLILIVCKGVVMKCMIVHSVVPDYITGSYHSTDLGRALSVRDVCFFIFSSFHRKQSLG